MKDADRQNLLKGIPREERTRLSTDWYQLTTCDMNFQAGLSQREVFELFIRTGPMGRAYGIACGLWWALAYTQFQISRKGRDFLIANHISREFADYLYSSTPEELFRGVDIDMMEEGSVFFPMEPVIRVKGPTIPAQLLETWMLYSFNYATAVASRARAIREVVGPDVKLAEFGMRRAPLGAASFASYSAVVGGFDYTSNTNAAIQYGIEPKGTVMHAQIQRFPTQLDAFRSIYRNASDRSLVTFLLDTYGFEKGLRDLETVAEEMAREGYEPFACRLDSGDLATQSQKVRSAFPAILIGISNDLQEFILSDYLRDGLMLDMAGIGTQVVLPPPIGGIYKLTAIVHPDGMVVGKMKTSSDSGKETNPGSHAVYRVHDASGMLRESIVAREGESFMPQDDKFLVSDALFPVMRNGRLVVDTPTPEERLQRAKKIAKRTYETLPIPYREIRNAPIFPVKFSKGLQEMKASIKKLLEQKF